MFLFKILMSQSGMADVPGTASTLSTLDAAGLRRQAWRTKAKEDSVRTSVFSALKTTFAIVGDELMITDHGIMLDVTNEGKSANGGGQSVVLSLRTPLKYAPREGTDEDMLGNEDETGLKYTTVYYNEIKKAVKYNTWGYDFNDTEYLNINKGYSKFVGTYWAELDDLRCQTALLMGFSNELTKAPVSKSQTFNPNWAIPSLATSSYPTWDVDHVTSTDGAIDGDGWYSSQWFTGGTTFAENIADALISAGTSATATISKLMDIFNWIEDEHVVEPIMLDGVASYIFKCPVAVYNWMINPANSGSIGEQWKSVLEYKDANRNPVPGEIGRLFESWVVVKDPRCPTLTVDGSNGSYSLTPGYVRPGNNDDRNRTAWSTTSGSTNYTFDIGAILGAEALAVYTRDDLMLDLIETTEYKKREGRGSYKGSGIQLCRYDNGTESATSKIYRGSCIIPFARTRVGS